MHATFTQAHAHTQKRPMKPVPFSAIGIGFGSVWGRGYGRQGHHCGVGGFASYIMGDEQHQCTRGDAKP